MAPSGEALRKDTPDQSRAARRAAVAATASTTPVYTPLTLINGWANYGFGTAKAAVANINGIVHLKGAILTPGNNAWAFTLPKADRPATYVYVPVDMCEATNGRLEIAPNGEVAVQAEANVWSNAQCFTSLDGVTFAKSANSFTPLTLVGGWINDGSGTARPGGTPVLAGYLSLRLVP